MPPPTSAARRVHTRICAPSPTVRERHSNEQRDTIRPSIKKGCSGNHFHWPISSPPPPETDEASVGHVQSPARRNRIENLFLSRNARIAQVCPDLQAISDPLLEQSRELADHSLAKRGARRQSTQGDLQEAARWHGWRNDGPQSALHRASLKQVGRTKNTSIICHFICSLLIYQQWTVGQIPGCN